MKKRIVSIALLLALTLSCAVACGDEEQKPNDTTDSIETTTDTAVETSPYIDDLPVDLKFGNATVNITVGDYNSAYWDDMYNEENSGNRYNEAVYRAILAVEERLEVNLEYTRAEYTWGNRNTHTTSVINQILANDSSFDILFDPLNYRAQMADGDYFVNLAETAYINLDQPWYNQTLIENSPTDYIHAVVGDFSIGNLEYSYIMYFNKELLDEAGITEDLYAVVDSGKWTLDKLESLITGTYLDDGNTVRDAGDRYGLTFSDGNKYTGIANSIGMKAFTKNEDGYEFIWDNERNVTAYQALVEFINQNENVLASEEAGDGSADYFVPSNGGNYVNKQFLDGNALFNVSLISDAPTIIPEVDFEFGILPLPKFDESQENYVNVLQRTLYGMIPSCCDDVDMASAVFEALTSEFHSSVIPEYVEVTLKTRYSPTDNISKMFDIATDAITFHPDPLYATSLSLPEYKTYIAVNNPNWVSIVAGVKEPILDYLDSIQ